MCIDLAFLCIDLASDVLCSIAMMNFFTATWLLRSFYGNCCVHFVIIRLIYHISIFKHMGVVADRPHLFYDVAPRAPLVKILDIILAACPKFPKA